MLTAVSMHNTFLTMNNKTKIKGDSNFVFQDIKKSKIGLKNESVENIETSNNKYAVIAIIVAIIGVIVTIIIGWDNIINFLTK